MADDDEFELERAYDREELAAAFRAFAAALTDDQPLRLDDGDRSVAVSIPPRVIAAFEAERDADDQPPVAELEIELEWEDVDGSSLEFGASELEDGATGVQTDATPADGPGTDESVPDATDDGEPETDPATATMQADAVAGADGSDEGDGDSSSGAGADANAEAPSGPASERSGRFEVYEDRAGQWRWRLVHWNGNIVADSGEGYASRSNARRAARGVMHTAPNATVEDRAE